MAEYHALLGELESFRDRLTACVEKCERAGIVIDRRYRDSPENWELSLPVGGVLTCNCGAVIPQPLSFQNLPPATVCRMCLEKTAAAATHDEAEEKGASPVPAPTAPMIPDLPL